MILDARIGLALYFLLDLMIQYILYEH